MSTRQELAQLMAVTLSPDGLISSLSPSVHQLTGYSAQELIGKPITDILAEEFVGEVSQMLDTARLLGTWDGDIVHESRSGRSLDGRGSLATLAGAGNEDAGFILVSAVSDANENISCGYCGATNCDIAPRLRSFAHELNNPLAVMMGFAQLILLNERCSGKVRSDVEKIYSELQRVIEVVERLHRYALRLQEQGLPERIAS